FSYDDQVVLEIRDRPEATVVVVGEPPQSLLKVLALIDGLEVYASEALPPKDFGVDLLIIVDPKIDEVPSTSALWLGSLPGGVEQRQVVEAPEVSGWTREHPLAVANWSELAVRRAYAFPMLTGATVLLESGGLPLIQARTTELGRQVVVAFPLGESNWERLTSFP